MPGVTSAGRFSYKIELITQTEALSPSNLRLGYALCQRVVEPHLSRRYCTWLKKIAMARCVPQVLTNTSGRCLRRSRSFCSPPFFSALVRCASASTKFGRRFTGCLKTTILRCFAWHTLEDGGRPDYSALDEIIERILQRNTDRQVLNFAR